MKISFEGTSSANPADGAGVVITRRGAMLTLLSAWSGRWVFAESSPSAAEVTKRGEAFLSRLFDDSMDLLPEYQGSSTYWLYHDNYLAAKMLRARHPQLSSRIEKRITSFGVTRSGKIEILFGGKNMLPLHHHRLVDVAKVGDKRVRTEKITDDVMTDWSEYADLVALAALAREDKNLAERDLDRLESFWDGKGFADRVQKERGIYATYKLALGLLAARRRQRTIIFQEDARRRLHALQDPTGGWITDYRADGTPVGLANVETTCIAMLALTAR